MKRTKQKKILLVITFILLLFLTFLFGEMRTNHIGGSELMSTVPTPLPVITNSPVTQTDDSVIGSPLPSDGLQDDQLFITVERQHYKSGDLKLIIPKLDLTEDVEDGTDSDDLRKGPGLYQYAQLPGEGDRNVSIAAHRNTNRNGKIGVWYFYYIDTLTSGDYLYLTDDTSIYQYKYEKTTVVDPYDWSPIYGQGFSCLTLTSCEPIGISDHRIVVLSKLNEIIPYDKNYVYESSENTP